MTTPVSARDHANMTVAEREFTFDALLADFDELDDGAGDEELSASADADEKHSQARPVPDAAAPQSAHPEARSAAPRPRAPRRPLALPSPEVLKLGGLIVVAALSLTLVFIALSR